MNTKFLLLALLLLSTAHAQTPVGTSFTYQGELMQLGAPADGNFDFLFTMFDSEDACCLASLSLLLEDVLVANGMFTVELDFGADPYAGDQLWLEIRVREGTSTDPHTMLAPRQKITAVPFAMNAESVAMNAVGSTEVDSSQVQLRVDQSCSGGSSIRVIASDGSVTCEPDDVGLTPVGAIVAFGGAVPPAGWLLCNGAMVARAAFADLYAVVGDAYGDGDGATTFHLPDLRGRFPRGVDGGVGRDPDAASRVASNGGGSVGDAVGSLQDDALQGHRHDHSDPGHSHGVTDPGHSHNYYGWIFIGPYAAGGGANFGSGPTGTSVTGISINADSTNVAILDPATDGAHGTPRISSETRPQNVSVNYIVKY